MLAAHSEKQDWNFYSDYVDHVQHHPMGNLQLEAQLRDKMDLPGRKELATTEGFKTFLYLAQVQTIYRLLSELCNVFYAIDLSSAQSPDRD